MSGIAVVETAHREACLAWLRVHNYGVTEIDFEQGIGPAAVDLGEQLRWEDLFGYRLAADRCNLSAIREGFEFCRNHPGQRHVLMLLNAEVAYREDPEWLTGLLAIAHEHSRWQLALGNRFFTTLILEKQSSLIGAVFDTMSLPSPYWTATSLRDPFATAPLE